MHSHRYNTAEQIADLPPDAYLERARGGTYICPYCGSGSGPKGTGMVYYLDPEPHFYCFACRRGGKPHTIAAEALGITSHGRDFWRDLEDALHLI